MRQRTKQAALTCVLALPLVITMVLTPAFTAETAAQPGQRMVGPQFPILIDTNGDGRPTPGDAAAAPQPLNPTTVQITSLFSCTYDDNERVSLTNRDSSGRFTGVSRLNDFRSQEITVGSFAGGAPATFNYAERDSRGLRTQGNGALVDSNRDGRMDSMALGGGRVNTMVTFVFTPDSSYVSIPVSQAAAIGTRPGRCGPSSVPQVWVPLADTNGDGIGDTIVFDLNGDGIADPEFYRSPALGATQVPSTNTLGLVILTILLGSIGVWYIGRRRLDEAPIA